MGHHQQSIQCLEHPRNTTEWLSQQGLNKFWELHKYVSGGDKKSPNYRRVSPNIEPKRFSAGDFQQTCLHLLLSPLQQEGINKAEENGRDRRRTWNHKTNAQSSARKNHLEKDPRTHPFWNNRVNLATTKNLWCLRSRAKHRILREIEGKFCFSKEPHHRISSSRLYPIFRSNKVPPHTNPCKNDEMQNKSCRYPKQNPQNPTKPTNHLPKISHTQYSKKLSLATRRSRNRVKMGDHRLPSTYIKLQNGNKESGTPTIPRLKESRLNEQITAYPLR